MSSSVITITFQTKLTDSSDWPTLGEEAAATLGVAIKKETTPVASNGGDNKDKKPANSLKPNTESAVENSGVEKINETKSPANAQGPVSEKQTSETTSTKEIKSVPKIDDSKRVSKPKWARLDVDAKSTGSSSSQQQSHKEQPRRRSPKRYRDEDYYYDRPGRRNGPSRGHVSSSSAATSSSRAPRGGNSSTSTRPIIRGSERRREPYITRSNKPSYTESKTPGLNGNPPAPNKSCDPQDAKKKPINTRAPHVGLDGHIITGQNIYGTFYFNGATTFAIDSVVNVKESVKKQV